MGYKHHVLLQISEFVLLGRFEGTQLLIPTISDIKEHRIVVTTLLTARVLFLMGIERGHFSHIFIDEAAQVMYTTILFVCSK